MINSSTDSQVQIVLSSTNTRGVDTHPTNATNPIDIAIAFNMSFISPSASVFMVRHTDFRVIAYFQWLDKKELRQALPFQASYSCL